MNYKLNYSKLLNLKKLNYFVFIIIIILVLLILLFISFFIKIKYTYKTYGIYKNNLLYIKINNRLSDVVKNNNYFEYNHHNIKYVIDSFGEIEIDKEDVYQYITLMIDDKLNNNEVIEIYFYYNEERLLKRILKLFI